MNTTLTDLIGNTWQILKEATKSESWTSTKDAFEQMSKLQEINLSVAKQLAVQFPNPPQGVAAAGGNITQPETSSAKRPTIRPRELRIAGQKIAISLNNQIAIETANWILDQGTKLPYIPGFLNSSDSGFSDSAVKRKLKDGSLIEIGLGQDTLVKKARQLLNASGLHHVKAEVLLENGEVKKI